MWPARPTELSGRLRVYQIECVLSFELPAFIEGASPFYSTGCFRQFLRTMTDAPRGLHAAIRPSAPHPPSPFPSTPTGVKALFGAFVLCFRFFRGRDCTGGWQTTLLLWLSLLVSFHPYGLGCSSGGLSTHLQSEVTPMYSMSALVRVIRGSSCFPFDL